MYLTTEEEKMLDGEFGEWIAKALKLIVKLGDIQEAERLIKIKRAHISGVSYKTTGDAMIELLEDMAKENVRVKVFTTLNPAGMDLLAWQEMGVPDTFATKQMKLIQAYKKLGILPALTCAPYFFENKPSRNEVVAFAESSAIIFVNSILGARTNRHGSLDALAAAVTGRVPLSGYLLDENRKAKILIDVEVNRLRDNEYGLIGIHVGNLLKPDDVPAFVFRRTPHINELRLLGAALAASGALAMFHVIGVTPNALSMKEAFNDKEPEEKIVISRDDVKETKEKFFEYIDDPDAVFIGCPHASIEEIKQIASLVSGRKVKSGILFWIFTSRRILSMIRENKCYQILINAGIKIFSDTCMVVSPIEALNIRKILTNSSKAAWYIPKFAKDKVAVDVKSLEEIIKLVTA